MNTCGDCLLRRQNGGEICPVFKDKPKDTDAACRAFIGHTSAKCDFCGTLMPGKPEIEVMDDGDIMLACPNCADNLYTCATCATARDCAFETSPINIPKQVQKVVRQGNMQMATVIRNPEREKETCMKGCDCWDEESCTCLRQNPSAGCKLWRYK